MQHLAYLAILAACLVVTAPLEIVLGARVYRQARRAALAILPTAVAFVIWDLVVAHFGWWNFNRRYVVGLRLGLPLEEYAFFVVVPLCALLTFEAVRRLRPGWTVEPAADRRRRVKRGPGDPGDPGSSGPSGPSGSSGSSGSSGAVR